LEKGRGNISLGIMECWNDGRMEEWKNGRMVTGCRLEAGGKT
jgi:hypothetical protein